MGECGAWVRRLEDPRAPSREARAEHDITHVPYRPWCEHRVRGRGKNMAHKAQPDKERSTPAVHIDYCFLGSSEKSQKLLTILVARDRDSKMLMSTVVPRKGSTGAFAAQRLHSFVKELGCEFVDVVIKTDQEPALISLVEVVRRMRVGVKTFIEHSPVGSSQSNGIIERGNSDRRGAVADVEERIGEPLEDDHSG